MNPDKYLKHAAGILEFTKWLMTQEKEGKPSKTFGSTIYFHPFINKSFALGLERSKKNIKEPFLAIHNNEITWFHLIQWDKICIKERDLHLYFITQTIKGDGENYPDIPAFCIALSFDTIEKVNLLKNIPSIVGREYYFDEEKISRINLHTKIFTLNIEVLQANQPHIIDDDSILTYDELLSKQEAKVISTIIDEPEFLGTIDKQSDSSYLFDKLNKKEL